METMNNIPNEYICPITLDIMDDPVLCEDGHTYERKAIQQLTTSISPITRQPINKTKLILNRGLKECIERYKKEVEQKKIPKQELHMGNLKIPKQELQIIDDYKFNINFEKYNINIQIEKGQTKYSKIIYDSDLNNIKTIQNFYSMITKSLNKEPNYKINIKLNHNELILNMTYSCDICTFDETIVLKKIIDMDDSKCKKCKDIQGYYSTNAAAINGHLDCLKYAHKYGRTTDIEFTCHNAAYYGHYECLKYAYENGFTWNKLYTLNLLGTDNKNYIIRKLLNEKYLEIEEEIINEASVNNNFKVIKLLNRICPDALTFSKYIIKNNYSWDASLTKLIVSVGNLNALKIYRKYKCPWIGEQICSESAFNGHLDCLKYAHENGCKWDENTCINAAKNGHLECLKYAHENGCLWNEGICYYAANYGHLECLKYAHENGCPWDKCTCNYAALNGHLNCLKYAHKNGCPWDESTCNYAATNGHLNCLKYAHENGCPWDENTCINAVYYKHLDCFEYALKNNCKWISNKVKIFYELVSSYNDNYKIIKLLNEKYPEIEEELIKLASENNFKVIKLLNEKYPDVITISKYIIKNNYIWNISLTNLIVSVGDLNTLKIYQKYGCKWDESTCYYAANYGHLYCLKYLHENCCLWDEITCLKAAFHGHLECLKYAHENGCPWDEDTCKYAANYGHLDCLKYAHENGCPWDENTCKYAANYGHLDCLKYAHENGCTWDKYTGYEALYNNHLNCLKYIHDNDFLLFIKCTWHIGGFCMF